MDIWSLRATAQLIFDGKIFKNQDISPKDSLTFCGPQEKGAEGVFLPQVFAFLIIRPTIEKKKIKLNNCSAGISRCSGHFEYTIATRGIEITYHISLHSRNLRQS
uniref:Uncharacterized protein n=1 Tax=Glossina pallidipes TaxID=7398 RepID=A0A1A9ZNL0_GLOPL